MKLKNLISKRYKETPADCQIVSQALMMRGGYIKPVGNGIFTLFPVTKRITAKIERILREEMDRIGGQEVLFPVADSQPRCGRSPAGSSPWAASCCGFKDRSGAGHGAGHDARGGVGALRARRSGQLHAVSVHDLPDSDEVPRTSPRCRGGLIRVREFTMKDGYSFHTSQEDLERYYMECYDAYNRIFARAGVPEVVAVASDSGMMGGKVSHEYMLLTPAGEDTIVLCRDCDYRANMEAAPCIAHGEAGEDRRASEDRHAGRQDDRGSLRIPEDPRHVDLQGRRLSGEPDRPLCRRLPARRSGHQRDQAAQLPEGGDSSGGHHPGERPRRRLHRPEGPARGREGRLRQLPRGRELVRHRRERGRLPLHRFNIPREMGEVEYVDVAKAYDGGVCRSAATRASTPRAASRSATSSSSARATPRPWT